MAVNIVVGAIVMANLAVGVAPASVAMNRPIHTHTVQFNIDLIEETFAKTGFHNEMQLEEVLAPVDEYTGPTDYGNMAINAPLNCYGQNTHLGCFAWLDGIFDPNRCADYCTAKTEYDVSHGLPDLPCRFFNTYVLLKNGVVFGQYCSLVSQSSYLLLGNRRLTSC